MESVSIEQLYQSQHEIAVDLDGGSDIRKHDLHKQISAFEKLLQHAMNKFSREKLYGMLKILTKDFSREYTPGEHVHSISQLKRMVTEMENKPLEEKHLSKETEKHVLKYFHAFFTDVEYLSELKKYFDEKIYIVLYQYYYDPLDDIQEMELERLLDRNRMMVNDGLNNNMDPEDKERKVLFSNDVTEVYTGDRKEEEIIFDFLSTKGKLSHAVRQMFKVNEKWDKIMNENDPHMECYDPDSKHELVIFPDYVKYEAVLRLVPDVFVKAFKSVELSKLWWTQANVMYPQGPRKKRTIKDIERQESVLESKIFHVSEDIKRIEDAVVRREDDLKHLLERENRFHHLNEQYEKLEERKDVVNQLYNTMINEVKSIHNELQMLEKGTKEYSELENRLKEKDKKLMLTQDELKLIAFHFRIVLEDFNLELELRPHLIRFRADIEMKITDLKDEMIQKNNEKRRTEKVLILLKTNCERMKQIMQKFGLGKEDSMDKPEKQLSIVSEESEMTEPDLKDKNVGNKTRTATSKTLNSAKKSELNTSIRKSEKYEVSSVTKDKIGVGTTTKATFNGKMEKNSALPKPENTTIETLGSKTEKNINNSKNAYKKQTGIPTETSKRVNARKTNQNIKK